MASLVAGLNECGEMAPAAKRVLIAEDDPNIASLVKAYLEREGFSVLAASDGEEALRLARRHQPAIVVLDLMLPIIDGWEVCRRLREKSEVPILILSARGEEVDRLVGFGLGADDYVVKPFSPRELTQRVKAILRRTLAGGDVDTAPLEAGGLLLDPEKRKATYNGEELALTDTEFRLLHLLMKHPGHVFSRAMLLDHLNPRGEIVVERTVDVHVGNLRQKLGETSRQPRYIETVRGVGYRFAENAARA